MKFTKETLRRALRTFIQAFIACIAVGIPTVDFASDKETRKAAITAIAVSGISAGISAVMNLTKDEAEINEDE